MQKVQVIVICDYETKQLFNVTVLKRTGEKVCLLSYDKDTSFVPYKHEKYKDMEQTIFNLLKNNGFYVGYRQDFNSRLYNINWIDLNNPTHINQIYMWGGEKIW